MQNFFKFMHVQIFVYIFYINFLHLFSKIVCGKPPTFIYLFIEMTFLKDNALTKCCNLRKREREGKKRVYKFKNLTYLLKIK